MVYGYAGKLLRINLAEWSVVSEEIDYDMARLFIGGRGYCAKLLFDEIAPEIDPISPDNKVIYDIGPATGVRGHPNAAREGQVKIRHLR